MSSFPSPQLSSPPSLGPPGPATSCLHRVNTVLSTSGHHSTGGRRSPHPTPLLPTNFPSPTAPPPPAIRDHDLRIWEAVVLLLGLAIFAATESELSTSGTSASGGFSPHHLYDVSTSGRISARPSSPPPAPLTPPPPPAPSTEITRDVHRMQDRSSLPNPMVVPLPM